jgi:hypothetical protein
MVREIADEQLLAGTARGEVAAFEEFYRRWLPAVMSYHRRATGPLTRLRLQQATGSLREPGCRTPR